MGTFKPLAQNRDRKALLSAWREKNAKKSAAKVTDDSLAASVLDGASRADGLVTSSSTRDAAARGSGSPPPRGLDSTSDALKGVNSSGQNTFESLFVSPSPRARDVASRASASVERERGGQASTSETTPSERRPGSSYFSLSGTGRRAYTGDIMMTIDSMPSPAVRARLKAVEIEKEALAALAAKLRESSDSATERMHLERKEAEEIKKNMSERLQKLEADRNALQENMAAFQAQAHALSKAKEEHSRALRKEKRAAEAAAKALEQVKEDAATALQERDFTIANQAAILQELDDELDRAERSRERAELEAAAKDKRLAQLKVQLDEAKRELDALTSKQNLRQNVDSSGVRASHEKLLQLAGRAQEAEADAARARQEVKNLQLEVDERRAELETVQKELEKCLQEERIERERAEAAYSEIESERNTLEMLVEKRTLEKIALEERLDEVSREAEYLRSEMEERDEMLREGEELIEAKENELESAVTYVVQLQEQLSQLQASGAGENEVAEQLKALEKKQEALRLEKQQVLDLMQREITQRDAKLSESKRALESKEAELRALQAEHRTRKTELGPLEAELQGLREKLYALKFELDEKNAQLMENDALVKQLMSAEKRQTANVRRLEFGLAERDEQLRNFNDELNNLKMESELNEKDIAERMSELRQREAALEELHRATEARVDELREQYNNEIEKLNGVVERSESRASELERQIELLKSEKTSQSNEQVDALKRELSEMHAKWQSAQSEITTLCTSIAELEHQAEESMSALKAELELTKGELQNALKDADKARATAAEVEADSLTLLEEVRATSEVLDKKIQDSTELVKLRESELKMLKKQLHARSSEAETYRTKAVKGTEVITTLETALKTKVDECERIKSEIVKAQKQLVMFQQELSSSKKAQKELQDAANEFQIRLQKSEEQRDMLAGSLARQEEYHESVNKAREEMHRIALEDSADEVRSVKRKTTVLATALQQHVRLNELDPEVALLVDEFAEVIQSTPQTALPTPTMTFNEPKTKPKTYRKTPAKPKSESTSLITPVRADASLKENIHKLNERADQISFNDLAARQAAVDSNVYVTPGNENDGARQKTAADGKRAFSVHSATKTRPALSDVGNM